MKLELRRVTATTPDARDARRSWPVRERLLLRLSDGQGHFGLGEAAPLPGYGPDDVDHAEAALKGVAPTDLERLLDAQRAAFEPALSWRTLRLVGELLPGAAASARMALETAALDWMSRSHGLPAPVLLGADPRSAIELCALAGPAHDGGVEPRVLAARAAGYRCFKLKVGGTSTLREEVLGVQRVREALGPEPRLRLDGNRCWSAAQLQQAWPELASAAIELFEEPGDVPAALLGSLPLALDESLQGLSPDEAAARVAASGALAAVLKPTALGGLSHCFALAEHARRGGAVCVLSHCFEGALAWRATVSLALALGGDVAHGLAPYRGLGATMVSDRGKLDCWSEPGLCEPRGFE